MLDSVRQYRSLFMFEGILFIILGLLAIAVPSLFTLGFELLVAVLFIAAAIAQSVKTFSVKGMPGFIYNLVIALLYLAVGVLLLTQPVKGVLTLTFILTFFFVLEGFAKIILSFSYRPYGVWGWQFFSGLASLLLAYIIYIGWPASAAWVIGLIIGINFIFAGMTQILLARLYTK